MNTIGRLLCTLCFLLGLSACNDEKASIGPSQAAEGAVHDGLVGAIFAELDAQQINGAAAGLKHLGHTEPLQLESYMGLGSNAKSLTAMLAAAMVEDGLLSWDGTLAELLPDLAADMLPSYRDITFAELLNHRSGLLPLLDTDEAATFDLSLLPEDPQLQRLSAAAWILAQEPAGSRGEFLYSNAGYVVAGVIMEQLSGRDFNSLLQDRILEPLGLSVGSASPAAQDANQPYGHLGSTRHSLVSLDPTDSLDALINDIFVATGTLSMNQANYGRYLQWHLRAFSGESTPIPFTYIDALKSLEEGDYALGWIRGQVKSNPVLFHDGATSGFESLVVIELSGKRAAFGLTNTMSDSWTLQVLNKWLLKLY